MTLLLLIGISNKKDLSPGHILGRHCILTANWTKYYTLPTWKRDDKHECLHNV